MVAARDVNATGLWNTKGKERFTKRVRNTRQACNASRSKGGARLSRKLPTRRQERVSWGKFVYEILTGNISKQSNEWTHYAAGFEGCDGVMFGGHSCGFHVCNNIWNTMRRRFHFVLFSLLFIFSFFLSLFSGIQQLLTFRNERNSFLIKQMKIIIPA